VFAALPPFEMIRTVTEPVGYASMPMEGFWVAPYLSAYYAWSPPFGGPFYDDHWYYDLPEGVVQPGGRVSGFLYFEPVRRVKQADFMAHLVDADTGDHVATIRIPFVAG